MQSVRWGSWAPVLAGSCLGFLAPACAQVLLAVEAEQPMVSIDTEAVLWIALDARGGPVWCGLRVDFGNGTVRDVRVGQNGEADLRSRIAYRFPTPGLYSVTVRGQALARGLRSVQACEGRAVSLSVRVVDSPVAPVQAVAPNPTRPVVPDSFRTGAYQGVQPATMPAQGQVAPAPHVVAQPGGMVPLPSTAGMVSVPSAGGMVPVPSFDTPTRPQPEKPASPPPPGAAPKTAPRPAPAPVAVPAPAAAPAPAPAACRAGPALEPREYTQPEVLGRPPGDRARMCFYRLNGSVAEYLQFFPSGHFYHTSNTGSGGFAMSGAVLGTTRGTYGFQRGNVLATRTGYQGIGVTQTTRGAGSERTLDVSGQRALEREMVLPNCQRITYRDELKRIQIGPGRGHPPHITVNGVKWESYTIDCPAWQGWIRE